MSKAWSNIECAADDPEIIAINKLESSLGTLSEEILQIRRLITGFEVCHFKYQKHLEHLRESILTLQPVIDPDKVGSRHIRMGEDAWKSDETGRCLQGQQYLWILRGWLGEGDPSGDPVAYDRILEERVTAGLGEKDPAKDRLVRLLIARMVWDWESYEQLLQAEGHKELEFQVCRMDVCHYAFPENMERVLKGIGALKPVGKFEGCGSFNPEIKSHIETAFLRLNKGTRSGSEGDPPGSESLVREWLTACLAKTLKEQVGLPHPLKVLAGI